MTHIYRVLFQGDFTKQANSPKQLRERLKSFISKASFDEKNFIIEIMREDPKPDLKELDTKLKRQGKLKLRGKRKRGEDM